MGANIHIPITPKQWKRALRCEHCLRSISHKYCLGVDYSNYAKKNEFVFMHKGCLARFIKEKEKDGQNKKANWAIWITKCFLCGEEFTPENILDVSVCVVDLHKVEHCTNKVGFHHNCILSALKKPGFIEMLILA